MRLLLTILAAALLLPAADFWINTEPGQWSPQEIKRLVTDSPWAKEANVIVKGNPGEFHVPGGKDSDLPPMPHILVRWESALPVCQACEKGGLEPHLFSCISKLLYVSGLSDKFAELRNEYYIIGLSNYPKPSSAWRDAPQHSEEATAGLERMAQRIQRAAFLKWKGHPPVQADRVKALPAGQALLVMVFFPRSANLTLSDKEVMFESSDGTLEMTSRFNLRKMVYKSKLEL